MDLQTEHAARVMAAFGDLRPSPEGTLGGRPDRGAKCRVKRCPVHWMSPAVTVRDLELHEPSLDDVFAEATGYRLEGADT